MPVVEVGPSLSTSLSRDFPKEPVIVRLAGMPISALAPLAAEACSEAIAAIVSMDSQLAASRGELVALAANVLPQLDSPARRLALAVKRSAFNGRELLRFAHDPHWPALVLLEPYLGTVFKLEARRRDALAAFRNLYARTLRRERWHVLESSRDPRFLRGVAVARPGLVTKSRLRTSELSAESLPDRPAKWEASLLRFLTRAATKFSANSTLTSYALGHVGTASFGFVPGPYRELSLVRIDRPELEQLQELLLNLPALRPHVFVAWNDTLEPVGPDRFRFFAPPRWQVDPTTGRWLVSAGVRGTATFPAATVSALQRALAGGPRSYRELADLLSSPPELDQLLACQALLRLPPWPFATEWLEREIQRFLVEIDDEPSLGTICEALGELIAKERGFHAVAEPERALVEMQESFRRLVACADPAGAVATGATAEPRFFEDVIWYAEGSPHGSTFEIPAPRVTELLGVATSILRHATLFNPRHDVLLTLAAWWRRDLEGRREAPFLEVAHAFAKTWRLYLDFSRSEDATVAQTFAPIESELLDKLAEERVRLLREVPRHLSTTAQGSELPPEIFAALVEAIPARFGPLLGPSLFAQPIDRRGESWVLNSLQEGTGRYLSRVTPVLAEDTKNRFLQHLVDRSRIRVEGEEADLLEVVSPWGNLVGAHQPQTWSVLELRGLRLDLPSERRLRLQDLTVHFEEATDSFRLLGPAGRRVLPVKLNTLPDDLFSNQLRLLLMFGPGEIQGVYPRGQAKIADYGSSSSRLTSGPLVIRRETWRVEIATLREQLRGAPDPEAFATVQRWRDQVGLPVQCVFHEPMKNGYPGQTGWQYLDFRSTVLCALLVASVRISTDPTLLFEEALPVPATDPHELDGQPRGFELLIESFAFRTTGGSPVGEPRSPNRETCSLRKEQ